MVNEAPLLLLFPGGFRTELWLTAPQRGNCSDAALEMIPIWPK
jgi:hypothetical protein